MAEIHVDREADVPVGVQLAWALRAKIASGELSAGERLPALRELAGAVGLNLNTVRAVYQRLEREGLISTQQGRGTFVANALHSSAAEIAAGALRAARKHGVSPREVAAALYVSEASQRPPQAEAQRRNALRGEIAALDRVLSGLEAAHPRLLQPPPHAGRSRGPSLLTAAELEAVRSQLVRRLAAIQEKIDGGRDEAAGARPASTRSGARSPARTRQAARSPAPPPAPKPKRAAAKAQKPRRNSTSRPATAST